MALKNECYGDFRLVMGHISVETFCHTREIYFLVVETHGATKTTTIKIN